MQVRVRGPKAQDRIVSIRSMTRDDLARLDGPRAKPGAPKRLRESHHMVAKLAAFGMSNTEIATHTGYSVHHIKVLLQTPAMAELRAGFNAKIDEKFEKEIDAFVKLKTRNMLAAERHISDHIDELDEANELLPIRTALAVSADGADRMGYGKKQTNVNFNVDMALRMEQAIARTEKAKAGQVLELRPSMREDLPLSLAPAQEPPSPRGHPVLGNLRRRLG